MTRRPFLAFLFLAGLLTPALLADPPRVLGPSRYYRPSSEQTGNLRIVGSTTLSAIAANWAEGFKGYHPKVEVDIDCKGTETAFAELLKDGVVGALSRPVTTEELKELEQKTGRKHVGIEVCQEGLAVIVHPSNPIPALTRAQLRDLLAMPSQQATAPQPAKWGQAGLTGDWANQPAQIYRRVGTAGSHTFFKQYVIGNGYTDRPAKEFDKTKELMAGVASDKSALGYCRWAAVPADVKVVPIVEKEEELPGRWSEEFTKDPSHRLYRRLSLIVACTPDGKIPPLAQEYLLYVLSKDGQEDVLKDGFGTLTNSALVEQFERLGFELDK